MIANRTKMMATAIAITFVLGGCAQDTEEPTVTILPSQTPIPVASEIITPQVGGSINLSMRLPKTLNPLLNEDITVDSILKLVFLPLSILDETEKPVPNSAFVESIDFSTDGKSAIVNLKSGKRWSDDVEITATDLMFSIETLRTAPETVVYKENVKNILSTEKLTDYSVKINFMQSFSGMTYLLGFPIVPQHYYKAEKNETIDKGMYPIGNGSYKFSEYTPVKNLKLVSSDKSFTPKTYIDEINVIITSDENTDLYSFEQGMIDVVNGSTSNWGKYIASNEYNIAEYVSTYYDFIGFNFRKPLFQEKAVREAIAYSVPYEDLVNDVYVNYAKRTTSPVSPQSWLYEESAKNREFNLETAKKTLYDAGWAVSGEDGSLVKTTTGLENNITQSAQPFSILVNSENAERTKIAEIVKENLKSLGFSVEVLSVGFEDYQKKLNERDFDMFIGGFNLSVVPELSFMLNSSNADTGMNYFGYKNTSMDLLLENAFVAIGDTEYKKAMSEVQKYISEELPCISLVFRESAVIMAEKIHGEIKPSLNNLYSNIDQWFIKK